MILPSFHILGSRPSPLLADLAKVSASLSYYSHNTKALIRNCASDGISTARALYSKLYEKLASMKPKRHTSSSSLILIRTVRLTGKDVERRRVSRFYFLISAGSKWFNNELYRKYSSRGYENSMSSARAQNLEQREASLCAKQLS